MTTTKTTRVKSPAWIRAIQIGIGAVGIMLSISAMIYPALAVVTTFTAAAIVLLLFGIEQVIAGIFLYTESRFTHIGLGVLIITLSSIVMGFPLATATLVVWLAALTLLLTGIASIISGLRRRNRKGRRISGRGSTALNVAAGALAIALAVAIMAFPSFGIELAGLLIGIALLIYGIRLIVTGISGHRNAVTSASSDTMAA